QGFQHLAHGLVEFGLAGIAADDLVEDVLDSLVRRHLVWTPRYCIKNCEAAGSPATHHIRALRDHESARKRVGRKAAFRGCKRASSGDFAPTWCRRPGSSGVAVND